MSKWYGFRLDRVMRGTLWAYVLAPSREAALDRLKADDPCWSRGQEASAGEFVAEYWKNVGRWSGMFFHYVPEPA